MDSIQKFYTDIEKIRKHDRASHGGMYDGARACGQMADLLVQSNRSVEPVARAFAGYWMETCIRPSPSPASEPTGEHLEKLAALHALLTPSAEGTGCLSHDDWKELCSLTNLEAEDVPLDFLNDIMVIFVDKQAL